MILLDTNHCSYIIDNQPDPVRRFYERLPLGIGISIITYGELLYMAEKSARKAENRIAVQSLIELVDIYLLDEITAAVYSQLKADLFERFSPQDQSQRRRLTIQNLGFDDNDLWIAATVLQHDLTLVSADSDFTRMQQVYPDFEIDTWIP